MTSQIITNNYNAYITQHNKSQYTTLLPTKFKHT